MEAKKHVQWVRRQVLKDKEYLKGLLTEIEAAVPSEEFREGFSSIETDKII
jgi:hypothetical protein